MRMTRFNALVALFTFISTSACFGNTAPAPVHDGDRGHAVLQLDSNKIEVEYGRPTLRGRNPEELIKPGQVWRMGSDNATTLTTQAALKFGETVVPAGKYILKAKLIEPRKWHLLIESESKSPVAEVAFSLQTLDSAIERLTISLDKKEKGGQLILKWGTLLLAADFLPVATTASAEDTGKWSELSLFHDVMSQTFHPMEEGELKPIRSRAGEMAEKAKKWADSKPPTIYDNPEIKSNLTKLADESKALAALVSSKAGDTQIKASLTALHDRFHAIVGLCRDAKKSG
ncbi:MAG TPA: DUF2911 domain-containing protein [Blastocatellia bacterium]|nr:DUF2911 domain-containing protein [Blastocatellia bacterium]